MHANRFFAPQANGEAPDALFNEYMIKVYNYANDDTLLADDTNVMVIQRMERKVGKSTTAFTIAGYLEKALYLPNIMDYAECCKLIRDKYEVDPKKYNSGDADIVDGIPVILFETTDKEAIIDNAKFYTNMEKIKDGRPLSNGWMRRPKVIWFTNDSPNRDANTNKMLLRLDVYHIENDYKSLVFNKNFAKLGCKDKETRLKMDDVMLESAKTGEDPDKIIFHRLFEEDKDKALSYRDMLDTLLEYDRATFKRFQSKHNYKAKEFCKWVQDNFPSIRHVTWSNVMHFYVKLRSTNSNPAKKQKTTGEEKHQELTEEEERQERLSMGGKQY